MFTFRKKEKVKIATVGESPISSVAVTTAESETQKYPSIVHQIHKEFNEASEKALKEAQQVLDSCQNVSMDKAERLAKLGFQNTKEVQELQDFKSKQGSAKTRAKLIQDASIYYPLYKFITAEDVKTLCTKYGLICGELQLFKGFVPEKNLKDIENSLDVLPKFYEIGLKALYSYIGQSIISQKEYDKLVESGKDKDHYITEVSPSFYICAPPKDMKQEGYSLKGAFLVKDDPIVLLKLQKGYLIIAAWGDEASDPLVVNEKLN